MLIQHLSHQLRERTAQGLARRRRVHEGACTPHQHVVPADGGPARELLAFCSNDYLGLANHPVLKAALAEGAQRYGVGSGASHLVSGHSRAHQALEERLAALQAPFIPEAWALTFTTGYLANVALLTALGDAQATLFTDKLNHASLIDGARLTEATVQRYPHGHVGRLRQLLAACTTPLKLIVTDSVFSMDGDLADLPALLALAEQFDAWLVIDDAHAFGVLGPQGEGSLAHFSLRSERLIVMGTLGKAAGTGGAFVAAHATIADALVQMARPYIYTTAESPALAHATLASIELLTGAEGDRRRAHLHALISQLRAGLAPLVARHSAWRLADSVTAIQPLIVGSNEAALALSAALEAQGLWVPAIRWPTVAQGAARLRITLSAAHTAEDVAQLIAALTKVAETLT